MVDQVIQDDPHIDFENTSTQPKPCGAAHTADDTNAIVQYMVDNSSTYKGRLFGYNDGTGHVPGLFELLNKISALEVVSPSATHIARRYRSR